MRIETLELKNFKKFEHFTLDLDPRFTLLAGDNGSGKTSLLDALAVAAAIFVEAVPEPLPADSRRPIQSGEARMEAVRRGDRVQWETRLPTVVAAKGTIGGDNGVIWTRQIRERGQRTTNKDARQALDAVNRLIRSGNDAVLPILAYYGAGRAWLPSNEKARKKQGNSGSNRWAALYHCFDERIRFSQLRDWFRRETTAAGALGGRMRPGFEVVKKAVADVVPGADNIRFDADLDQIVVSIEGNDQPLDNCSAGQRMMVSLIADLSIKAITQNASLVPREGREGADLARVLRETPGIALIDELDVHLHPSWQRRIAQDLKRTFPSLQFVCTSHSPQVIGELQPNEVRVLEGSAARTPSRTYGVDSNRVLQEVMGASARDATVNGKLERLGTAITQDKYDEAKGLISSLEGQLGRDDPDVIRQRELLNFLTDDARDS